MSMRNAFLMLLIATSLVMPACQSNQRGETANQVLQYPETRVENVVDTLHGVEIVDPYRWLEDGSSKDVVKWTELQNQYTRSHLDAVEGRDIIKSQIEKAMEYKWIGAPVVFGERMFFKSLDANQDQTVLYTQLGNDGAPEVLVDPNVLGEKALVALDWHFPSPDGELVAYGLSIGGDERSILHVIRASDKQHLSDTIPRTDAASIAWLPDASGFYYTRYPLEGEVPQGDEEYYRRVYFHKLGESFRDDPLVFGDQLDPVDWPNVMLSESGRYLVVYVFKGWSKSELHLIDMSTRAGFKPLVKDVEAFFDAKFLGDDLYVYTNYEAPKYRILKADLSGKPVNQWEEVVPEDKSRPLKDFYPAANRLVLSYLEDVSSKLDIYDPATGETHLIQLPGIGSTGQVGGAIHGTEIYFAYVSFFYPQTVFRYDVKSKTLEEHARVDIDIDSDLFTTEFVKYRSADDTEVSMFIVHRKDIELDGNNPAILTGYGGFKHSQTPYFSNTRLIWLNHGGVYAIPHLRGGGEYGEEWHKAGMLENKQNTFDDFIAAAEYLIENGYTKPEKLAIWGGSNGGLLVGAAMVQRPDLFKAVICGNPLLDMIRYSRFLIAKLWIPEYGSSDDPEQFHWLYAYSPYHHVKDGIEYPASLVKTSESDTRVDPMHARKMAARLQAANSSANPQMLRFEFDTGHGQGMPTYLRIEDYTDSYAFLFWQLGVEPNEQDESK